MQPTKLTPTVHGSVKEMDTKKIKGIAAVVGEKAHIGPKFMELYSEEIKSVALNYTWLKASVS